MKVGIKLLSHGNRDFILDNDVKVILDHAQRTANPAQAQSGKKRPQTAAPATTLTLDQLTYSALPFQSQDLYELTPVLKHLDLQNNDTRALLAQAKQAYKDGAFERAFDLYSQCINALL